MSTEINTSFLAAAKAGEEVLVTGKVLKYGKRMGFTAIEIHRKSDGQMIASGRHTKAF